MAFEVIFLKEVEDELDSVTGFYLEVSESLAKDLLNKFYEVVDEIARNPLRQILLKKGYRKMNLDRFPFKVIYRFENDKVIVVAFAHHKRKQNYWKKRK
jgi:toxin ParE1/3/4